MKKILLVILICVPLLSLGQKMYVWCPENFEVKPRIGLAANDSIGIAIFDSRAIPSHKKIECTSDQFVKSLFLQLQAVYPSAILTLLPAESYYQKKAAPGKIIIKIGISAYQAGFGSDISGGIGMINGKLSTMVFPKGEWNALTAYSVQVLKDGSSESIDINNLASRSNMLGYSSARKALNESYNKSNQELLFFIDRQIQK
jgi:hypothetical protein